MKIVTMRLLIAFGLYKNKKIKNNVVNGKNPVFDFFDVEQDTYYILGNTKNIELWRKAPTKQLLVIVNDANNYQKVIAAVEKDIAVKSAKIA